VYSHERSVDDWAISHSHRYAKRIHHKIRDDIAYQGGREEERGGGEGEVGEGEEPLPCRRF